MCDDDLKKLKKVLNQLPPGKIDCYSDFSYNLFVKCLDKFAGGEQTSFMKRRYDTKIDNLEWDPPVLRFNVLGEGETYQSLIYAPKYEWRIDIEKMTAFYSVIDYEDLSPRDKPLYVEPIATDLCSKIKARENDPRLIWYPDGVKIDVSLIIPNKGPKMTVEGRRKRLYKALSEKLKAIGYVADKSHGSWYFKLANENVNSIWSRFGDFE